MERGFKTFFKCIFLYLGLSLIFVIFAFAMQYIGTSIITAIDSNTDLYLAANIIAIIIGSCFGAFLVTKIERLEFPEKYDYIGKALCIFIILLTLLN